MKKIAVMSLMIVLFIAQYSNGIGLSERSVNQEEQYQELTKEQAEEMLVNLLASIDAIGIERIPPNPDSPLCEWTLERMLDALLLLFPLPCQDCYRSFYTVIVCYIVYSVWCYPY